MPSGTGILEQVGYFMTLLAVAWVGLLFLLLAGQDLLFVEAVH